MSEALVPLPGTGRETLSVTPFLNRLKKFAGPSMTSLKSAIVPVGSAD